MEILNIKELTEKGVELKHSIDNESIYKIAALVVLGLIFSKLLDKYL